MYKKLTEIMRDVKPALKKEIAPFHPELKEKCNFYEGQLTIVGGRPAMGKSSFCLNTLFNLSKANIKSAFISMEDSPESIAHKISEINNKLKTTEYDVTANHLNHIYLGTLTESGDLPGLVSSLYEDICRVIFIEGLNHLNPYHEPETLAKLKELALDFNIAIVITTNLNPDLEWRSYQSAPRLSDLPPGYENIADQILLLYRPEYYGLHELENGYSLKNMMEIRVLRNRFGALGTHYLEFENEDYTYFDIADKEAEEEANEDLLNEHQFVKKDYNDGYDFSDSMPF